MTTRAALPRALGAFAASGTLVGIMIGSGIFRVPSAVATLVPDTGWFLAVWVVGGLLALAGAFVFAEFAAMFPDTGGRYVYLREGISPVAAYAYAIGNVLLLRPTSLAARAMLIAAYIGALVPVADGHAHLTAAAILIGLGLLNVVSTRLTAASTAITAAGKAGLLGLLALLLLAAEPGSHAATAITPTGPLSLQNFGLALVTVVWTYSGWGQTTYITGEVRDAERTMPRVLIGGVGFVIVLFLALNLGYLHALGLPGVAASSAVATDAASAALGARGAQLVSVLVIVSVLGSLAGSMFTSPRLPFALGQDSRRLRALARVHGAYQTPHVAVAVTVGLAVIYLWGSSFEKLVSDYILGSWPFYVLCGIGFFRLRRLRPDAARPYRAPGYPWVPGFFLATATAMVINGFAADPIGAITGSWVMLIGIPVYWLVRDRPETP
ncbi:MAG: amino acid permease [Gemmatimonadota bacterium]